MLSALLDLIWPLIYANCLFGISTIAVSNEPVVMQIVTYFAAIALPLRGVYYIIITLLRGNKVFRSTVIQTVLEVIVGVVIVLIPNLSFSAFVIIYEIYLTFYIAVKLIDVVIYSRNKTKKYMIPSLVQAIFFFVIFVVVLTLPGEIRKRTVQIGVGITVSLFGLANICDFLTTVIRNRKITSVLGSIRLTMPGFIAVSVPHRLIHSIRNTSDKDCPNKTDAEIFFMFGEGGLGTVGHCELCVDGRTYSFGSYDPYTRKIIGTICKSLILRAKRDEYIDWCVNENRKKVIVYGLKFNEHDKAVFRKKLDEFDACLTEWEKDINEVPKKEYIRKLNDNVDTDIYRVVKGRFKSYFIPTINCVMLLDYFLSETSVGQLIIPGISTPGAYMDVIHHLYSTENETVVSLKTYGIK